MDRGGAEVGGAAVVEVGVAVGIIGHAVRIGAHRVVGEADRDRHRDRGRGAAAVRVLRNPCGQAIASDGRVTQEGPVRPVEAHQVEVVPADVGVPGVGLVVGDGAGPALAGPLAAAWAHALGVLLPGHHAAGALDAHRLGPVGAAPAGAEALGLEPDEATGLALCGGGQHHAPRRPHAGVGVVADQREALVGEVVGALHALRAGDAEVVLHVEAGGVEVIDRAVRVEQIAARAGREAEMGLEETDLVVAHRVVRAAAAAVLARPDDQHLVAVRGGEGAQHVTVIGHPATPVLDLDRVTVARLRQVGALPGCAVVEADRAEGVALAVARKAPIAVLVDALDVAVGVVPDQRPGFIARLGHGRSVCLEVLDPFRQQRPVRALRRHVQRQHADGRELGLELGRVGDVLLEHHPVVGEGYARRQQRDRDPGNASHGDSSFVRRTRQRDGNRLGRPLDPGGRRPVSGCAFSSG